MRRLETERVAVDATPTVFEGIPEGALAELLGELERRRYPPGAVVIAEGDRPREISIVVEGHADVFIVDRNGQEHEVGRVGPGTTLGEMSLFTGEPAAGTVRAATELEVLAMSAARFEQIASDHPVVYRNVGTILASRLRSTNRLAARDAPGNVVAIEQADGPPLLPWALASSVAWHTRARTVLLVVDDNPAEPLRALADRRAAPSDRGATLRLASLGSLGRESLPGEISRLLESFEYVLVATHGELTGALQAARAVQLGAHSIRIRHGAATGNDEGASTTLPLAALTAADDDALVDGLLPPRSDGSRTLGWVARDLARLKVGLALGAGSLRGYAHIGVLSALHRVGLEPDFLAGTSVGGAVAGLYALGYTPDQLTAELDRCANVLFRPTLARSGLMSNRALRNYLHGIGGERKIEDLPLPLAIVAADLDEQREVVFRRGPLWLATLATISIPGVFPALRIDGRTLVDGGIVNPVPTTVVDAMGADAVVAVRLSSPQGGPLTRVEAVEDGTKSPSAWSAIMRSVEMMQSRIVGDPPETPTISITPSLDALSRSSATEVPGVKLRRFSTGRRYVEAGIEAAEAALPRLSAAFPWLRS
jgi:NTE family protein